MQKEGYKALTGLRREKPYKRNWGSDKKFWLKPWPSRIRRESFENFLKSKFEHVKIRFEKLFIQFLIDQKLGSIDRKCFDWTSINRASIETDRGWPKFLITISINRNSGKKNLKKKKKKPVLCRNSLKHWKNKMHKYEVKCFSKTQVLNPISQNLRFSIHSLKFLSIKYDLHKTQRIFKLGWSNQRHTQ